MKKSDWQIPKRQSLYLFISTSIVLVSLVAATPLPLQESGVVNKSMQQTNPKPN